MTDYSNMNDPNKCCNCGSQNIIGPYDMPRGSIFFGFITAVKRDAYICTDCFHTMFFIRKKDRHKVKKEAQKFFSQYQ